MKNNFSLYWDLELLCILGIIKGLHVTYPMTRVHLLVLIVTLGMCCLSKGQNTGSELVLVQLANLLRTCLFFH